MNFRLPINSAFWELYLHAVLKHLKFEIDFNYSSPDFVCNNKNVIIEAAIASNSIDSLPEWKKDLQDLDSLEYFEMCGSAAIRLSNAFHQKAGKYQNKQVLFCIHKESPYPNI